MSEPRNNEATPSAKQRAAPTLEQSAREWDAFFASGSYRDTWHLDHASPELMALLAAGVVAPPCRALDLGCGAGTEAVHLAAEGFEVTALDVSGEALAMTRRLAARRGVRVATVQAFVPSTTLPPQSFDFINDRSCFHAIEPRLEVLVAYATEAKRLLKPGGVLFIRRFGQPQISLSVFRSVFRREDGFDPGRVQEVPFHEPHMPSRVAVIRRLGPSGAASRE